MKIKCPLCGFENEKGSKFCKNCNEPLVKFKIPNAIENPYTKKEKPDTSSLGPKEMLDIETFCNTLIDWVVANIKIKRKGLFQSFLKDIEEFGADRVVENQFFVEIIYFYMWLAYTSCVNTFQNKNKVNDYFSHFIDKMHGLFFKIEFGGYEKEGWIKYLAKKINGYTNAYNLLLKVIKGDSISNKSSLVFNQSSLGREFYKNLYGREGLGAFKIYVFTTFVNEELKASFKTLGKLLMRYEI